MSAEVPSGSAREAQRQIARHLAAAGIDGSLMEARVLITDALGCDALDVLTGRAPPLDGAAAQRLRERLARRLAHEPLAYIVGEREFWSLPFHVSRDVLIPRPDSETLVEAALRARPDPSRQYTILDLGTGSGCLLAALLREWPAATGIGVDISADALRIAHRNAARLGLAGRATFVCADWDEALGPDRFDIIVSNPPYLSSDEIASLDLGVAAYEPHLALAAGVDGLAAYRRVLPACRHRLAAGGVAFIEITAARLPAITPLIAASHLQVVDVKPDFSGNPRCLVLST